MRKEALLIKVNDEMEEFRIRLLRCDKEEILANAYKYSTMEDIVLALESQDISETSVATLLSLQSPLSTIYDHYLKLDDERMEDILSVVVDAAKRQPDFTFFEREENNPRYVVEETSDAFSEPYIIRDRMMTEDKPYYETGGIYQTFDNMKKAQLYASRLNFEKLPYANAFFVDDVKQTVSWMYYNPDALSGGQYVENTIGFSDYRNIYSKTSSPEVLFERWETIAKQNLWDAGTEAYAATEKRFFKMPDGIGRTKETVKELGYLTKETALKHDKCPERKPNRKQPRL